MFYLLICAIISKDYEITHLAINLFLSVQFTFANYAKIEKHRQVLTSKVFTWKE